MRSLVRYHHHIRRRKNTNIINNHKHIYDKLTWFFSMRVLHLGQRFVLAKIQFAVSLSFWHFSVHVTSSSHDDGWWASSPHLKQNALPQPPGPHLTLATPAPAIITRSQPGAGHHRICLLLLTNCSKITREYFWSRARPSFLSAVPNTPPLLMLPPPAQSASDCVPSEWDGLASPRAATHSSGGARQGHLCSGQVVYTTAGPSPSLVDKYSL